MVYRPLNVSKTLSEDLNGQTFDNDSKKLLLLYNVFTFNGDAKHIEDKTVGTLAQM